MIKSNWFGTKFLALGALLVTLSGCGGGSSSSPPPPPPPPPPPANEAPTANAGPDQTVDELTVVTLDGSGSSDSDGSVDAYAWMQVAGTTVTLDTPDAAMPTFTAPDVTASETLTFELIVTDDDGEASSPDTVDITVEPIANQAPVADAGPDQTVDEQTMVTLDGSGSTDADGTVEDYAWTQTAGTAVTLDTTNPAMPTFMAPDVAADETLTFELVVTDDVGDTSAPDTVNINVVAGNEAPTANAGPDQTVDALATVTLDGTASVDNDGTITAYDWTQTEGDSVTLDLTDPAMPTFTAPDVIDGILRFELVVTDDDGATSDPDEVVITVNPTIALPFNENFDDGNFDGWTIVDNDVDNASDWGAGSGRLVQSVTTADNFGDVTATYRRGTYAVLDDSVGLTNYRFRAEVTLRNTFDPEDDVDPVDDLGIMFRYTDDDNYYRFSMNAAAGDSRLESKSGGAWSTLAHNFRGYDPRENASVGDPMILEAVVDGPLIHVIVDGDPLFAARNTEHSSGGIALYTRDSVRFDNISIEALDSDPDVVIASPVADTVVPSGPRNVTVTAIARNVPPGGSVDIDFIGGAACDPAAQPNPGEYTAVCASRPVGDWSVRARVLNDMGGVVSSDRNDGVFIGQDGVSDRYDAIGDSLTLGLFDNYRTDNLATGPKTLQVKGWTAPLSDLLEQSLGQPNLVGDEAISGDRSEQTRNLRLLSILERNDRPKSNRALVMLGTNDANLGLNVPSGSGCVDVGGGCDGTYKGNMIDILGSLIGTDRSPVYLAILPPVFGNNLNTLYEDPIATLNDTSTPSRIRNIQEYNNVIINELVPEIDGVELGPDFFSCFLTDTVNRFSLFEDQLHMNGLGYAFVAELWRDVLVNGPITPPVDPCPAPIYILENLVLVNPAATVDETTVLKQNLMEVEDKYYRDADEPHVLTSIPPELADGVWIQPRNADRTNADAEFMSFDVGPNPVTVYIAHDPAGGPPTSNTLTALTSVSTSVGVSDPAIGGGALDIVLQTGVTGTVTIGGTATDGNGGNSQAYLVIVVPE